MKPLILTILLLPAIVVAGTLSLSTTIDTDKVFTAPQITAIEKALPISVDQKTTMTKVLSNVPVDPNEIQNIVDVLNQQVKGKKLTQDEMKYMTAMNNGNKINDRVKYMAQRSIDVDKLSVIEVTK